MIRRNYKKTPFRSHTDINNYNNFLIDLDNKNSKQVDNNIKNTNKETNYKKENIKIFVKEML